MAPEIHQLDPDGDVVLTFTRYVEEIVSDVDSLPTSITAVIPAKEGPLTKHDKLDASCTLEQEVDIRVSSRHLTLVSPVFRAMLQRHFSESNTLRLTGSVEVSLPDDDPDAFLVVLNIIHGHIRKVPLTIDLETLTQISILVDKYDIHESVELFSDLWFEKLKPEIPSEYTDMIPAWICVCWVFNKPQEFKQVTRLALRQLKGDLPVGDLPIPSTIVEAINGRRQGALHIIISDLQSHFQDYLENEHCSFECDSLMLGALTKRLRVLKILPDCPGLPYNGLSFEQLTYRFRNGMYFPAAQRTSTYYYSHSKCAIKSVDRTLAKCEERLEGLELSDYKVLSSQ